MPGRSDRRLKRPGAWPQLVLTIALAWFACPASAATPAPGRYCAREEVTEETDSGETLVGAFLMTADLRRRGTHFSISFMNRMPDNPQILSADPPVPAVRMRDGSLRFRFDDGWGNRGEGRFSSDGTMRLRVLRRSRDGGSNITRNYGTFRLSRSACSSIQAHHD